MGQKSYFAGVPQQVIDDYVIHPAAEGAYKDDMTGPQWDDYSRRFHPQGLKEGIMERLIKALGKRTSMIPPDIPYLEQYLHPDKEVLTPTDQRPTQARPRNMPYYQIAQHPDNTPNLEGLGHYNSSVGADENGPYRGVFDVWDFNTESELTPSRLLDPIAKMILKRMGTPYAVYGRLPVEEEKSYAYPGPQSNEIGNFDYNYDDFDNPGGDPYVGPDQNKLNYTSKLLTKMMTPKKPKPKAQGNR